MDYIKNIKISIYENISDFLNKSSFTRYFMVSKYGQIIIQKLNTNKMIVLFSVQNQMVFQKKLLKNL